MALRLEDKKALVKEVNAVAGDSVTAVAAEYRGLSVSQMTELRKEARNAGVYMRVIKNTLARRARTSSEQASQEVLQVCVPIGSSVLRTRRAALHAPDPALANQPTWQDQTRA